jgi:CBS domain-containing protein
MRTDAPTCLPDEFVSAVAERTRGDWPVCVVTNGDGVVQGVLDAATLEAGELVRAEDAMLLGPRTIRPSARREMIAKRMHLQEIGHLVVTHSDGAFVGVVLREDL